MVNLQDPRVLRTRQLIRDAFRALLRSKGFDAISIKDIARHATINRATFYDHYVDKYALLDETIEQAFHAMIPEEVKLAKAFTAERCEQLILMTYGYMVDFYRICRMDSKSIASHVDEKIKNMLEQTIEGIFLNEDNRRLPTCDHIKILSAMTSSTIYSAAYRWLTDGEQDRADLLVNIVRPYVMNGLGSYRER
ncbi:TetR/AcrR family transcriptional regulator [Paenibacillus glycinis]|uniref:TetR family transcriptional regulator n=1 Tax=Paenibacillus glycinis TaxID=2697035 RepID=A0ABW9XQQ6_9BACL|nr:TetR/AcrR family transcriptional regulator [Paenibacillus glycinis]NBD24979.1 TetR family transcriptional regulator [Paenibacillus glycinis]